MTDRFDQYYRSRLFCPGFPIQAVMSRQSCPISPVMVVLFCLPCSRCLIMTVPFWLSHSGCPRSACPILTCPILPFPFWLSRSGCPLFLPYPSCLLLAALCWQPCPGGLVLPDLSRLSHSGCPALAVMFWLFFFPTALSFLFCPGCLILAAMC
jgi:hypothetical protein